MEVAIDQRRRHQPAGRIDGAARLAGDARLDTDDLAAGAGDVDTGAAVRQARILDEKIERTGHQRSSLRNGISRLAGASALRETNAIATMVKTKGSIRNT